MKLKISPLFLLIAIGSLSELKAAVVYSDDFSGIGNLHGSAPDDRPGSETWTSRTNVTAVTTDGDSANVLSASTSWLPLTVASGNVYTVSATLVYSGSATTASIFAGIGFFNGTATTDTSFNAATENTPWMFLRAAYQSSGSPGADAQIGDISTRSYGNTNIVNTNSNLTVTTPVKLTLVLDTTSAQWQLNSFYEVGGSSTQIDLNGSGTAGNTFTYSALQTTALGTNITRVGLSNSTSSSLTGSWSNFQVDVVPEPSIALLAAGGVGLLFSRRRRMA